MNEVQFTPKFSSFFFFKEEIKCVLLITKLISDLFKRDSGPNTITSVLSVLHFRKLLCDQILL